MYRFCHIGSICNDGNSCRRLLNNLDAIIRNYRLAKEQDCGKPGGSRSGHYPYQREALRCRSTDVPVHTGMKSGKTSFRKGPFVPVQFVLDYVFPLSHCSRSF